MKNAIFISIILIVFIHTAVSGQKSDKTSSKIVITGTVTGLDGNPAADAQIYVDSVDTGVTTNDLGKYKIKVSPGAKTVFAYSYMKGGGEAVIDGRTTVDIRLDPRQDTRPDFSGAITEAEDNSVTIRPKHQKVYTNIYQMIREEVPGVLVSGSSIVVQQQNSFFGSSQPLFLVNGARVNNISNINPVEVKSIVLLKGSQAAVYGMEGANGVLSITLKSGAEK
jgi:outer membrane receptor protein involved in Fe transport